MSIEIRVPTSITCTKRLVWRAAFWMVVSSASGER